MFRDIDILHEQPCAQPRRQLLFVPHLRNVQGNRARPQGSLAALAWFRAKFSVTLCSPSLGALYTHDQESSQSRKIQKMFRRIAFVASQSVNVELELEPCRTSAAG